MPGTQELELVWSPAARADLIRLRKFIEPHNPEAAQRSAEAIKKGARLLREHPAIGTRLADHKTGNYLFLSVFEAIFCGIACKETGS